MSAYQIGKDISFLEDRIERLEKVVAALAAAFGVVFSSGPEPSVYAVVGDYSDLTASVFKKEEAKPE